MLRILVVGNGEHSRAYAEVLEDIKGRTPDVVTLKEVTCNQDIQDAAEIIKDANGAFTLSTVLDVIYNFGEDNKFINEYCKRYSCQLITSVLDL
jgi:hypothetical protein